MKDHLIIVSVDAMVREDLALLRTLPHVSKLIEKGSIVRQVTTIYPSLTHAVHATLMSGCTPGKTGVIGNEHFLPGQKKLPWYNLMEEMQCETIFHAAKRAGMVTCACRWPLTAGAFNLIDYLVPEVMATDVEKYGSLEEVYMAMCTPSIFEDIVRPTLPMLDIPAAGGPAHPYEDLQANKIACEIIRKYRPHLLLTHPSQVDSARHQNGLFNDAVDQALVSIDGCIGDLMKAVEDAGIADATSFAIVSDHGQLEIRRAVAVNVFLRDRGWIDVNEKGELTEWRAYAHSCGLSAQVHVKNKEDEPEVEKILRDLCEEGLYGFSEVLTLAEVEKQYGLSGDFSFVLETDGYTSFNDDWNRPAVRPLDISDYRYGRGTHGHRPEKGPQPCMILSGSAFKKGVTVESARAIDEAPTFAAALGLTLPMAEGKVIDEVLAGK